MQSLTPTRWNRVVQKLPCFVCSTKVSVLRLFLAKDIQDQQNLFHWPSVVAVFMIPVDVSWYIITYTAITWTLWAGALNKKSSMRCALQLAVHEILEGRLTACSATSWKTMLPLYPSACEWAEYTALWPVRL